MTNNDSLIEFIPGIQSIKCPVQKILIKAFFLTHQQPVLLKSIALTLTLPQLCTAIFLPGRAETLFTFDCIAVK